MKTYLIYSTYEYEIEAENEEDALEKWHERIEDELADINTTIANDFAESLKVKELNNWLLIISRMTASF